MKKALIVYGGWEGHDPKNISILFEDILKKENFEVIRSDDINIFSNLKELITTDLIVPIITMSEISGEYVKNIGEAIENGCGIAGCHGGMCDAFRNNTEWQFITGSQFVAHPGGGDNTYKVEIRRSSDSEIIKDIPDFMVTSEQYYIHVDPCVNILATTRFPTKDGPHTANGAFDMPVVYTKRYGLGKVFYNSIGHTVKDFKEIPEALEIMRRGFVWSAR